MAAMYNDEQAGKVGVFGGQDEAGKML